MPGATNFCPQCGRATLAGLRYCGHCGFDLEAASGQVSVAATRSEGWGVGSTVLIVAALLIAAAIGGLVWVGLLGGALPGSEAGPTGTSASPTPRVAAASSDADPTRRPSPTPRPTTPPARAPDAPEGYIDVDLTLTGLINDRVSERLPLGGIGNVLNQCRIAPVASDATRNFVTWISFHLPDVPGESSWDLIYEDLDGPGDSEASLTITNPEGFDSVLYIWYEDSNRRIFNDPLGTVTYSSDLMSMTFDVRLYEIGSLAGIEIPTDVVNVRGTLGCSPP